MKIFALFGLFLLLVQPTLAQDDVPYIYYISNVLNGIVIERADGTDSRIIGQNMMSEPLWYAGGPGWSPDGRWFAWDRSCPGGCGEGRTQDSSVISINDESLAMLAEFPHFIDEMLWHPSENILLVYGLEGSSPVRTRIATYWVIDVDTQTLLVSMSIESDPEYRPIVYWFDDHIKFYETSWLFDRFYLVTMDYDGDVDIDLISREEFGSTPPHAESDARNSGLLGKYEYPSFTMGNYAGSSGLPFTPPQDTSAAGRYVSWNWHEDAEWLFVGYERCYVDCGGVTGRVSIYNPETEHYREISDCGPSHTCVGWLPERVDVSALPEGRAESVLARPQSYYEINRDDYVGHGVSDAGKHILDCNVNIIPRRRELVRNRETDDIDFVLPSAESCDKRVEDDPHYYLYHVVFALSPDEQYYAITKRTTNGKELTAVYVSETGDLIAPLSVDGTRLWFSDDSQTLFTSSNYRGAAWDMQALIANHAESPPAE